MAQRTYLAIDLKSYYASAECAARHLDPLTTNLVVADSSRTEKTICLAVSPSLKAYGIPGRARLFEVIQKVKDVNANRLREAIRLRKAVYKDGKPSLSSASYDSLSLARPLPESVRICIWQSWQWTSPQNTPRRTRTVSASLSWMKRVSVISSGITNRSQTSG